MFGLQTIQIILNFYRKNLLMIEFVRIFAPSYQLKHIITMAEIILKDVLKRLGMSQKDVAEKMGISPSLLNMRINSDNPTLKSIEEIADAIGVSVTDLIKGKNSSTTLICPHCGKPIQISLDVPKK